MDALIPGILIAGGALIVLIFIGASLFFSAQNEKKLDSTWRDLAKFNDLDFHLNNSLGRYPRVTGMYKGYQLKLEVAKEQGHSRFPAVYTHLVLVRDKESTLDPPMLVELAVSLFTVSQYPLMGKIYGTSGGRQIFYKQYGIETDLSQLIHIFSALARVADAYPHLLAAGGRAVPHLEKHAQLAIVRGNNSLRPITIQLLREIERDTTARLAHQAERLLCSYCLVPCEEHLVHLSSMNSIIYYGCRDCHQSRNFVEWSGPVVAVLDDGMETEFAREDGVLQVNWFLHRLLFQFEAVEIIRTTDEAVERFAMQLHNDTNKSRRSRYKKLVCTVSPGCNLSENSMRILRHTFGRVE